MEFRIGSRVYRVRRQWDLSLDGQRCLGLCATGSRVIWLDGELSREAMVSTLRHELHHAWEAETSSAQDEESRANLAATVAEAFEYEFEQQGGLSALLEIEVEGLGGPRRPIKHMNYRADCDRRTCACGTDIMVGSIHSGEPEEDTAAGGYLIDRGFQCPVCDRVQVWKEKSTTDGRPLGEFYFVRLLTGAEADEWVRSHAVYSMYNVA